MTKIGKTAGASGPASTKKSKKSNSGAKTDAFGRVLGSVGAEDVAATAELNAGTPLTRIDDLLFLQEVDESPQDRQAVEYGEDLLQELEKIRLAILTGQLDYNAMQQVLQKVNQPNFQALTNPQLKAVIDDIILRVRVELAKFES